MDKILTLCALLISPVSGQLLTNPGPLCAGETVTLTCDISGGMGSNLLTWNYNDVSVISIVPGATTLPAIRVVSGMVFTVLDTQMDTVSQISFVASVRMSGRRLECVGNDQTDNVTLHVDPVVGDDVDRKFRIDEVTGLIETTATELDRETRATYTLTVSVTDSGTPQRMSTATVTITVTDVNAFALMCDRPNFAFSTEEANRLPIELGAVTASDGDNVPGLPPVGSGQLLYQLASPNPQVTVTPMGVVFGEPGLDFDTLADGTFTFAVVVSDRPADPSRLRSTTCRVTVTLTDENDNVPRFDESLYEATILEDATLGSVVTVVNAEDSDSGTNGEFIYSIRNSISVFSIDPLNGEVTLTGSLDSAIRDLYELDVEAIDNGVPSNVGVTILRISIADVDDISPRFDRSFYQEQLSEGTSTLTTVTTLRATDPDSTSITYSFSSGNDGGMFWIDGDGVVRVTGVLDRETTPIYNLAVRATDDSGNFGTTLLRVDITDINDVAPLFGETEYNAFIAENSPEGTLVLPVLGGLGGPSVRIQAIDADEPNSLNSVVRYSLSGPNAARFNIETSGRVTVARGAVLDFELEPVVAVNVVAMDSDPISPMSSTVVLYVRLIDVNDIVPRFTRPFGYVEVVDENLEVGGIIATVTANDEDSVGGTVRYRLTDAVPFSAVTQFSVNRTNGQISLLEALDRETDSTITLIVTASDMGEPALSSAVNVQITVRDVNDNPPEFVQDIFTTTVPEFLALGGLALQVTAVDPDGPGVNSEVVYSLVGTQNTFTINPATGDITTIDSLDFESVQFHSFMVMACDRGSPVECDVVPVRINVGDFNDQIPTFDQTTYVTDVCYDGAVSGTALVQPVAVDGDSGTNAVLSYSLLNNPSLFVINASTGRVWLAQEPTSADVESHTFTIMAQDMGDTPLSSSAQVMIRILNCTEQTFYFTTPFHYLEIVERGSRFTDGSGSVAIDLSNFAQSVDFMPARPTNPFSRVLNNIQLKMFSDLLPDLRQAPRGLDREARSLYTVILRARDSRGIDSFTSVTLEVLDANDNSPVFSSDLVVFQTAENQTAPLEIGSVVATDVDEGSNAELEYRILSVTLTSIFSIDMSTGVISAVRELDRETQDEYDITIQASDGVGTDTIAVRVTVQDVNDCPPMFVEEVYRVEINENVPQGSSVASVRATDCDDGANAVLRYSITGEDVGGFELYSDCGAPAIPSNASVLGDVSSTAENAIVTFQCEEGLVPSHPINITCTRNGQWSPDPAGVQCRENNTQAPTVGTTPPGSEASTTITSRPAATSEEITLLYCEEEMDVQWSLNWPRTVGGTTSLLPCPLQNSQGETQRQCFMNGTWSGVVDTSRCRREVFEDLLIQSGDLGMVDVAEVIYNLSIATSPETTMNVSLFSLDIQTSIVIIGRILDNIEDEVASSQPGDLLPFRKELITSFDNLLVDAHSEGWQELMTMATSEQAVSTVFLKEVERFATYVGDAIVNERINTGNSTKIMLSEQNIVLEAVSIPNNIDDIEDIHFPEEGESTFTKCQHVDVRSTIPADLLIERGAQELNLTAVNVKFCNLEAILPSFGNETEVGSSVISSQTVSELSREPSNSEFPVQFFFETAKFDSSNFRLEKPRCAFVNTTVARSMEVWSLRGIETLNATLEEENGFIYYTVHCQSFHLTSFAVLVDIHGTLMEISEGEYFALSVVTYIGCGISIVFLAVSIVALASLGKELFSSVHFFVHLNLSIALLLGYIVFIAGVDHAIYNRVACAAVAALLNYLFIAVFCWMLCEGLMLYLMLVVVFSTLAKKWWFFMLLGWGLPLLPVVISVSAAPDKYGTATYCWLSVEDLSSSLIWLFIVPLLVVILFNAFFLLAVLRSLCKVAKDKTGMKEGKPNPRLFWKLLVAIIILHPLLGLTWLFGFLAISKNTTVFIWIFTILNSLQGLFVFIFHIIKNDQLKKKLRITFFKNKGHQNTATSAIGSKKKLKPASDSNRKEPVGYYPPAEREAGTGRGYPSRELTNYPHFTELYDKKKGFVVKKDLELLAEEAESVLY